ncbi:serine hydrolase [Nocardia sp. GCM10030253]|uniref:serine hydrolase n=1 Tax=Nocardia sp. GCM10030253 TaxID=3273404 RepID=UPI00362E57AF
MTRCGRWFGAIILPAVALLVSCSSSATDGAGSATTTTVDLAPNQVVGLALPDRAVEIAVEKLDGLVESLMADTRIPGMAVAVVHGGKTVYSKGFGFREVGRDDKVDSDTVFQLASVSKSLAATVVAHQVGAGSVSWDMPVVSKMPWFALREPYVTANVTVGDLFAHRSGLPEHAGDRLEDVGYDRRQVLDKLRMLPLDPFRDTYHYTNFGLTAAAEAVADAAGAEWAQLSADTLYTPLGMSSTSSRFDDYRARSNRAVGHMSVDGSWVAQAVRNPDAQAPAGGASSSVRDMAQWLAMMLGNGEVGGKAIAPEAALLPAITPQVISGPASAPDARAGFYGYGFNVSTTSAGRVTYSHSGAFALGAATNFLVIPSADVAIVALTNAAPIGVPETLTAEFADILQYGKVREDWRALYRKVFAGMDKPEGELVGKQPPSNPAAPQSLTSYTGTYSNDYWGPVTVSDTGGTLVLAIGPAGQTYPLKHWDGDIFTFELSDENAPPGTISKASFTADTLTLEYFDEDGLGTFKR